ncbi:hypothetical protein NDU88_002348 [Pleurodeles waltl]|uniref:ubiquitinyl hydrolase 1 n=1 Tax=Pleurodeles waltl TaxID=8319 RepID=A0AAV7M1X1_PLEWA|nr:hypothetical protein NDU88_002348 [Pleurodeles waltl]
MDSGSASWGAVSSLNDVPKHKLSLGPVPGAAVYSNSLLPEKNKLVPQTDQCSGDGISPPQKILFPSEKICLKWQQIHRVGAGLQNLGNTCFVNSALQCLTYTPPLANYMLSHEHTNICHEQGFCMMCTMQAHVTQALANSGSVIKPMAVINDLRRIAKHFRFGNQEDAHEFIRYTIDAMQKACLDGSSKLDRHTQATTLICQIFGGYLRSRVKCLNCKGVSDTFDPYLDIPLEIKTAQSVSKALEQFVKPEQLDGENAYKCSKCKKMVPASKRFSIHRSSNVLTLSLKRFANFSGGKITKEVKYPEYLDIRPYMSQPNGEAIFYVLYAVLVHSGFSCHAGHYYCYVKASNGQWYQMNDSVVSSSDIRSVLNQQAYVLFYIRSSDLKNGDHINSVHTPGQSSPRPLMNHRVISSKQTPSSFIGPQLPHHMIKNSNQYSGAESLKETPSCSATSPSSSNVKRPFSAPPSASHHNWQISRPTVIPEAAKKQKITINIHNNKLPARQGQSQPVLQNGTLEHVNKPLPSSTVSSSSALQSTSQASASSSTNIIKQAASNDSPTKPVLNGKCKVQSGVLVPYGEESSDESDEESKGLIQKNSYSDSMNGILSDNKVEKLKKSQTSCENSDDKPSLNENVTSVTVNGIISMDGDRKVNGFKHFESSSYMKSGDHAESCFLKTNGLHGKAVSTVLPSVPEDQIVQSFIQNTTLKTLSEEEKSVHATKPKQTNEENDKEFYSTASESISHEKSENEPHLLNCRALALSESNPVNNITKEKHIICKIKAGDTEQKLIAEKCSIVKQHNPDEYNNGEKRKPQNKKVMLQFPIQRIKGTTEKNPHKNDCSPQRENPNETVEEGEKCARTNSFCSIRHDNVENNNCRTSDNLGSEDMNEGKRSKKDNSSVHVKRSDLHRIEDHHHNKVLCEENSEQATQYVNEINDSCYKRRHSHSKERTRPDRYIERNWNSNTSRYRPYDESCRSDGGKASGKYSYNRDGFRNREKNEHGRGRYYNSKRERYGDQERYYPDRQKQWDDYRYNNHHYSPYASRDGRDRRLLHNDRGYDSLYYNNRPHKDFDYRSRWMHSSADKDRGRNYFSSSTLDHHPRSLFHQYSGKYHPEETSVSELKNCYNDTLCRINERKRKFDSSLEDSDSDGEERQRKSFNQDGPFDGERWKKHKKSKKKKRSKDKYKYKYTDSDESSACSDSDNHRYKKKKKKKRRHERKYEGYCGDSDHLTKLASYSGPEKSALSTDDCHLGYFGPLDKDHRNYDDERHHKPEQCLKTKYIPIKCEENGYYREDECHIDSFYPLPYRHGPRVVSEYSHIDIPRFGHECSHPCKDVEPGK